MTGVDARRARRRWVVWLLAALIIVQGAALAVASAASPAELELYDGILPDLRGALHDETAEGLSVYTIDVALDPEDATIDGREQIDFVNDTGNVLTEIAFRLYPNAPHYDEGALAVRRVRVDGVTVEPWLDVDDTVMLVPLEEPLPPDGRVDLDLRFTTTTPTNSLGTYGIFSQSTDDGTWVLADWYPIIAGYEADRGWRLDPPIDDVDPTFSAAALYDVTFTAPAELMVVATGSEVASTRVGDDIAHRFVSGPAREFSLVADDDYTAVSEHAGETTVTAYVNPGGEDGARAAVALAVQALEAYSRRFGPYPYEELDLVDTPLGAALGVSWSGIIFINGNLVYDTPVYASNPDRFEYLIAHEVGHQWWGGMVGANSNDHTFMTEGITNAAFYTYLEMTGGEAAAFQQLQAYIVGPYLAALESRGDGVVDVPYSGDQPGPSRGALDYGKAAIGFLAIRVEIGDEAYFSALRRYADRYRFEIGEPDDLLRAFEAASGQQLDDLWIFWFESAETTAADVEAVVAGL